MKNFRKFGALAASIIVSLTMATFSGQAVAQQQTGLLANQVTLHGAGEGKTVDVSGLRYISFASNDAYVIKKTGAKVYGSMYLNKVQNLAAWKNYVAVTPLLYLNTQGVDVDCINYQTVLEFAAGTEVRNDNCSLRDRIKSQSDTTQ